MGVSKCQILFGVSLASVKLLFRICFVSLRAIPQLVWHRQNWNILYPLIDSNDETDIENLTSTSYYIAGFTDASIENRNELYDIFANSK